MFVFCFAFILTSLWLAPIWWVLALLFFFFPFSSFLEPLAEGMIIIISSHCPAPPFLFFFLPSLLCLLALAAFGGSGIN